MHYGNIPMSMSISFTCQLNNPLFYFNEICIAFCYTLINNSNLELRAMSLLGTTLKVESVTTSPTAIPSFTKSIVFVSSSRFLFFVFCPLVLS